MIVTHQINVDVLLPDLFVEDCVFVVYLSLQSAVKAAVLTRTQYMHMRAI